MSDVCSSDLMTELVDGKPLVLAQPAAGVECLLLEEEADLVAGLLEVAVASVHLLARREDAGDARGIEARHQLFGARLEGVAVGRLHHALEHQEAVARVGLLHRRRKAPVARRRKARGPRQIGRRSCRERGGTYVYISVSAVSVKK